MGDKLFTNAKRHLIIGLRACGPCSKDWLEFEVRIQTPGVNHVNSYDVVTHLLIELMAVGDVEFYDEDMNSYILTDKYYHDLRSRGEE